MSANTFTHAFGELDALTSDMAARLDEYERVNTALRVAVEQDDAVRARALSARSAAYGESVAVILARLRGIGAGNGPLPADTGPLPAVIEPLG